jgi:hypothetical protein
MYEGKVYWQTFRVDLDALRGLFDRVEHFAWAVSTEDLARMPPYVTVVGTWRGHPLTFRILAGLPWGEGAKPVPFAMPPEPPPA